MHDPDFVRAGFRLLLAIEEHHLGTPLAMGWYPGHADALPHLRVQVEAQDFKEWLDTLGSSAEVVCQAVEGGQHVHAHGALLHNEQVQVHLVTVQNSEVA
jgi:hypothetical protein